LTKAVLFNGVNSPSTILSALLCRAGIGRDLVRMLAEMIFFSHK
jgi:hypothetical protein